MFVRSALALLAFALAAVPALAACPSYTPGTDAQAMQHNRERLICLNRELSETSAGIGNTIQLNQMTTAIQQLQLQRRLDNLPRPMEY